MEAKNKIQMEMIKQLIKTLNLTVTIENKDYELTITIAPKQNKRLHLKTKQN